MIDDIEEPVRLDFLREEIERCINKGDQLQRVYERISDDYGQALIHGNAEDVRIVSLALNVLKHDMDKNDRNIGRAVRESRRAFK